MRWISGSFQCTNELKCSGGVFREHLSYRVIFVMLMSVNVTQNLCYKNLLTENLCNGLTLTEDMTHFSQPDLLSTIENSRRLHGRDQDQLRLRSTE
jgi:hypothetical protein